MDNLVISTSSSKYKVDGIEKIKSERSALFHSGLSFI